MANIYYLSRAESIIFPPKMEFHQPDIRAFLLESIPFRFKSLSPPEFTAFIGLLFEADGYELVPDSGEGDFSNTILARKAGELLVIQGYRNEPDVLISVEEVRKAAKAKVLFSTNQSWIVTTSAYSDEARTLAEEEDIELWDWEGLYHAICQLYFEGKNHMEYQEAHPLILSASETEAELKLKVKWQAAEGVGAEWFNLGITISNPAERNIYIHLELPALIDHRKNQIMADQWVEGEFVSGMIYAGASVRTNALFYVAKLGDRPPGGRIVLTCHERRNIPVTYHLNAGLRGEACFVVTYCYTRHSPEYKAMILFRDEVLYRSAIGRRVIGLYYLLSPPLVNLAAKNHLVDYLLRKFTALIIPVLRRESKKIKSTNSF
jgi:Restriction endonuclease